MNLDEIRVGSFLEAQAHFYAHNKTSDLKGMERNAQYEKLRIEKLQELILQKNDVDVSSIPSSLISPDHNNAQIEVRRYALSSSIEEAKQALANYNAFVTDIDFDGDFEEAENILLKSFQVVNLPFIEAVKRKDLFGNPLDCLQERVEIPSHEEHDITESSPFAPKAKPVITGQQLEQRMQELGVSIELLASDLEVKEKTIEKWLADVVPDSKFEAVVSALSE